MDRGDARDHLDGRMGERTRNRCRERLETLAAADLDPEQARLAAIAELRHAVGFERWCWPLTDPLSGLATGGIAEFDLWPTLPRLISLQEHGDVATKPRLLFGSSPSVSLSSATGGDIERSAVWRECLQPYGIGDTLMTACRERDGSWGSVELMRDRDDRAFDEDEVSFLETLSPTLGTLLRRSLASSWRRGAGEPRTPPPGTLILDRNLNPCGWTSPAREWLDVLQPGGGMLPPAIYEIATRVLSRGDVDARHRLPARVRIRTPSGRWSVLEGALLEGADDARVAITMRAATGDEVVDILSRVHGLTPRERQIVALLRAGLATKQMGGALGISAYTVKDHVKAIFEKTGARSRGELISQLTATATRSPDSTEPHELPESSLPES
jgi:DNA-binding CsgD family transcriptional regulator